MRALGQTVGYPEVNDWTGQTPAGSMAAVGEGAGNASSHRWLRRLGGFLGWSVLFGLAYAQAPLYTSNQNQYFLHGAAAAGVGHLSADWLAQTADPTPLFSLLVRVTLEAVHPAAFYAYYFLLFGVYLTSLAGIASTLYPLTRSQRRMYLVLLIALHSAALRVALGRIPGSDWSYLFEGGVAGQRLLGDVLQPSALGVFLLLSLYLFLKRRPYAAAGAAALAASVHPTYLLSAAALTLAYMVASHQEGKPLSRTISIGLLSLLLILPILAYTWTTFQPSSPTVSAQAVEVLVRGRIPHHAIPAQWVDATVGLKAALVAAALVLARRSKLFVLLLLPTLLVILLTAIQILTGSDRLALLFPWRPSTFIVPAAVGVLSGALVVRSGLDAANPAMSRAAVGLVGLLVAAGTGSFAYDLGQKQADPARPMMDFVARSVQPAEVYFIPPKLQDFRLAAGAPAFVEFKAIPYRDVEVLAWHDRLRLAQWFHRDRADEVDCGLLAEVAQVGGVTHVVLESELFALQCPGMSEVYKDEAYAVYRLVP